MPTAFRYLIAAAAAANMADQMMLVALPLIAVLLLQATADAVGLLVAAHVAAWFAISMPAGILVDRLDRRALLIGSQLLASLAYVGAWAAAHEGSMLWLLLAAFVGSSGIVLFVLTTTAMLPTLATRAGLPAANARLELARGAATIAAPATIAALADGAGVALAGVLASCCALLAALCLARLPRRDMPIAARPTLTAAIRTGASFVLSHPLLRDIALCALFWNFAFFALAAAYVPFALGPAGLAPKEAAITQAAYGVGALLAAASGGVLVGRRPPNLVLLLGPGVSVLAGGLILVASLAGKAPLYGTTVSASALPAALGWFLIGFGPVLWLICQTTVRQLVTPQAMIGRVSATIQTAIYGTRPLGALCGGAVAAAWGPTSAIALATAAFAISFVVVLGSPLGRLASMPVPAE